jgi:hypothetical protein
VTAVLLTLLALGSFDGADGVDRDPDFLAPFLGLTDVDAEDLARDSVDPLGDTRARQSEAPSTAAPFWVALIPSLSIELVRRQVRLLSGGDRLGLTSGTVLLIEATFGLAGDDRRSPEERERAGGSFLVAMASRGDASELGPAPPAGPQGGGLRPAIGSRQGPAATGLGATLPTIAEVQRATEDNALVRLADLDGWRSRARASAWLPELGVSYQRNVGEIDTLGIQSNLGIDSHDVEDVARYGVRATWQLGQLVFSREEVAAAKAALEVQRDRQELVAHVTELYFEWLRKRVKLSQAGGELESLALAELQAKIDALTDGFLSRRLRAGEDP